MGVVADAAAMEPSTFGSATEELRTYAGNMLAEEGEALRDCAHAALSLSAAPRSIGYFFRVHTLSK